MIDRDWSIGGMIVGRGNPKYLEKETSSIATSSTTNHTRTTLELNTGFEDHVIPLRKSKASDHFMVLDVSLRFMHLQENTKPIRDI
jgi:hypothetical protein